MLTKGSASVLLQVTEEPTSQEIKLDHGRFDEPESERGYNGTHAFDEALRSARR